MRRLLLPLASALSLLLFIATIVLWPASYRRDFVVTRVAWPRSYLGFRCVGGRVLVWSVQQPMTDRPQGWHLTNDPTPDAEMDATDLYSQFSGRRALKAAGFGATNWQSTAADGLPYRDRSLIIPLWAALLASASLPAWSTWIYLRTRQKSRQGHCPACGYDLTANTSGTCPECGTAIAGKAGS